MRHLFNVLLTLKMFAGHIKVHGGPDVAHGLNVAQAWFKRSFINDVISSLLSGGAWGLKHPLFQYIILL
jgi:hypothetical protein